MASAAARGGHGARPGPWRRVACIAALGAALAQAVAAADTSAAERPSEQPPLQRLRPAPASLLVSEPALRFGVLQQVRGEADSLWLAYRPVDAAPVAVAALHSRAGADGGQVCIVRLAVPGPARPPLPPAVQMAATEHLYGLVLGQDALAGHALATDEAGCAQPPARTQADVLEALALERRHWQSLDPALAGRPAWHRVQLSGGTVDAAEAQQPGEPGEHPEDRVSVRVADDSGRPLRGATVFFHRAPHDSCVAVAGPDGTATCQLIDQHGDAEQHVGEARAPVLATYPGQVEAGWVRLPTTRVIGRQPR